MEPDQIDMMNERELRKEIRAVVADLLSLRKTFHHIHSHIGKEKGDDSCSECGLDLRNPIHQQNN